MNTTCIGAVTDEYLGFVIREDGMGYSALASGWHGPSLTARSLPLIRKEIWLWWHRVS